ncbi:unnamed protein product [Oncorhynchus mykiss]|uniref:Piezo TM1-24 domain-containing protein n=1 Tax=Oncorhynchus mykiss TaxID=8022 RepID=A0A060YXU4_ONCMY|nr:unnamed protein product [Oncorhynchus mykiss]
MEEEEGEDDEEEEESNKMKILRHIAGVASKVKEIIGNLITTAGKVVVTILLGVTGITLPSLTSAVYFFVFLFLCTWWSFCRTFDTLIFSCMCVLMAIFSAGHLVVLYLYQFQFFQESIPPEDSYIRLDLSFCLSFFMSVFYDDRYLVTLVTVAARCLLYSSTPVNCVRSVNMNFHHFNPKYVQYRHIQAEAKIHL